MKMTPRIARWLALLALCAINHQFTTVFAQGTAFNYQGRLNSGTNLANGVFDFRFTVYASTNSPGVIIAGPLTSSGIHVSNGLFSVTLDFGVGVFTGASRWLQLDVRTNGTTSFATLLPRQSILPMPYAVMANTASNLLGKLPTTQLVGNLTVAQLPSNVLTNGTTGVTLAGTFTGNGAGLTNLPSSGGGITWQNVTGTNQQAQPNTGYLANNAGQVTITLPTSPKVGDIVRVSGVGAGGWKIAQNAGQQILTDRLVWPYLGVVTSSSDGTRLAALGMLNYISTNSGAIWTPSGLRSNCTCIASSSDGRKLVAASGDYWSSGSIYTSANFGATWTLTSTPTNTYWTSVASSTNGTKLVAAGGYGGIFTSANSGATWTLTSAPTDENWVSVASSSDGSKLVAAGWFIYTSADSGATWTLTSAPPLPTPNYWSWSCVASSSDGSKLVAAGDPGAIYTSADSGATWTLTSAPTNSSWVSVASSSDGSKLFAVTGVDMDMDSGSIYTSTNSGATWTSIITPTLLLGWTSVACSSDGSNFFAAGYFLNLIYTPQANAQTATSMGTAGYLTGAYHASVELVYIGNGQFWRLHPEGSFLAY